MTHAPRIVIGDPRYVRLMEHSDSPILTVRQLCVKIGRILQRLEIRMNRWDNACQKVYRLACGRSCLRTLVPHVLQPGRTACVGQLTTVHVPVIG